MNIKEQIGILIRLQKIETEAGSIKSGLNAVTQRLEKLDDELREFEKNITDEESCATELKKKYRDYEADAQINLSALKKTQEKQRAVKTNKEYQSLLKEIEEKKTKNSEIEDQMLECLDRLDMIEEAIKTKKAEHELLSNRIRSEKEKIDREAKEGMLKLADLDSVWQDVAHRVEPNLLERYNILKGQQAGGLAVAPVRNATCYGCNVNLPPQLYNELHRWDDLKFCPNCQRIIYWDKSD